jgi:hypothetical protein
MDNETKDFDASKNIRYFMYQYQDQVLKVNNQWNSAQMTTGL